MKPSTLNIHQTEQAEEETLPLISPHVYGSPIPSNWDMTKSGGLFRFMLEHKYGRYVDSGRHKRWGIFVPPPHSRLSITDLVYKPIQPDVPVDVSVGKEMEVF